MIVSLIGGAYLLGKDIGEKNLDQVKTFKSADVPKLITNLENISNEIADKSLLLDSIKEHEKTIVKLEKDIYEQRINYESEKKSLSGEIVECRKAIEGLTKTWKKFNAKYQDIRKDLNKQYTIEASDVELGVGEAEVIIPNVLVVGFVGISFEECKLMINNNESKFRAGQFTSVTHLDKEFSITLVSCSVDKAKIRVDSCRSTDEK